MRKTRLVRITKTSEVNLLGSSDQRKMNSIRRITKSDPTLAEVFAEPVMDVGKEIISWYTDLPGSISPFSEVAAAEQKFLENSWDNVCRKLRALCGQLEAADRIIVENIIEIPGSDSLYLVGHGLLVTEWSSVKVGYRPRNKNLGIEFDPEPFVPMPAAEDEDLVVSVLSSTKVGDQVIGGVEQEHVRDVGDNGSPYLAKDLSDVEKIALSKPERGFIYSLWFWGSIFLLLCVLNWFLLIDACGVAGIQFLNFCR
jgi:hypothetical protein